MADTSNSVLFDAPGPKGRRTIRIVNWIAGILFAVVLVLILMRLHNPWCSAWCSAWADCCRTRWYVASPP